ncbi:MAG: glycoside hydrolase family 97 N-terminal domain-containing protein, partial [Endomicrobia bacterium]|nr:glycoside hydrolase family 97 N-terminal domain-containing protein [Endomicrobiia bacterium]
QKNNCLCRSPLIRNSSFVIRNCLLALFLSAQYFVSYVYAAPQSWVLESPSRNISVTINLTDAGTVNYSAKLNGKPMILDSSLGINITGYADFTSGLEYKSARINTINETYEMISGKFSQHVNRAEELTITFVKDSKEIQFVFRAYNDGMAFRYFIDDSGDSYTAGTASNTGEITEFQLTPGSHLWAMPYTHEGNYNLVYREYNLGQLANASRGIGMPMLIKTVDGNWMNIAQAELNSEYSGVKVIALNSNGLLKLALTDSQKHNVNIKLPWKSPWRVAVMGTPKEIAETMIFENLAKPNQLPDTSWIKPGVSAWSWLSCKSLGLPQDGQMDKDIHKKYIDLAAEMGWPYYTMDAGWDWMSYNDQVNVIQYAKDKGIGIFVWRHVNQLDDPDQCEAVLSSLASRGIVGIKVDFVWYERQTRPVPSEDPKRGSLEHYKWIIEIAARHKIMVNFQNAHPSSGERRTYPHVLRLDGIRNAEYYIFNGSIERSAYQNTLYPFIRSATGPTYYAPFVQAYRTRNNPISGGTVHRLDGYLTTAHLIALPVLLETGSDELSDIPSAYIGKNYTEFFKNLPSAWDESRILDGAPGEYAVIGRRKGDSWYVVAVTEEERQGAKTINLPMSFLGGGTYNAFIVRDGATDDDVRCETKSITKTDIVPLPMRKYGGAAIKITKGAPVKGAVITFTVISKDGAQNTGMMTIPEKTFSESVIIDVKQHNSLAPAESNVRELQHTNIGVIIDAPGNEPKREMELRIPYNESDITGMNEDGLVIARYDEEKQVWIPLKSKVDSENKQIIAYIDKLSVYAIMGTTNAAKAFENMKYYPNPLQPSKGLNYSRMQFSNMPAGTRIKIYTLLGQLVRELEADASGMAVWDGKNNAGAKAASGVYIVYMEDGSGNKKRIKVAVER